MAIRLLVFFFVSNVIYAQDKQTEWRKAVVSAANEMGRYYVAGDHERFIDFMYPAALKRIGGRELVLEALNEGQKRMLEDSLSVVEVSFEEPEAFYENDTTIQCIISQRIKLKMPQGTLSSIANLFAISEDSGRTWSFLDVSRKTASQISSLIPVFDKRLKIPKKKDPVFSAN